MYELYKKNKIIIYMDSGLIAFVAVIGTTLSGILTTLFHSRCFSIQTPCISCKREIQHTKEEIQLKEKEIEIEEDIKKLEIENSIKK